MWRWMHAWFWTALWIYILGRSTHAFPVGPMGAVILGAVLVAGIYLPLVLMRREREPDLSGDLSPPIAVALGGLFISALALGATGLFGYWDQRPRGATLSGLAGAIVALHLLVPACIAAVEHWLWPRDEDE